MRAWLALLPLAACLTSPPPGADADLLAKRGDDTASERPILERIEVASLDDQTGIAVYTFAVPPAEPWLEVSAGEELVGRAPDGVVAR